jgi:hypothetical protein
MPRILKIDNFEKDFKPEYGLDADGSCYLVISSFYLEIISSYETEELGTPPKIKPVWTRIKLLQNDMISITKAGCFVQLKDYEGFVECMPENLSKEGEPKFDTFPKEMLRKIGKDIIDAKPMTFEERGKLIIARA